MGDVKDDWTKGKGKRTCTACDEEGYVVKNFYESNNPLASKDGYMVICKVCTKKYFNNDIESLDRILRILDKPFKSDIWERALNHKNETLGTYISNLNNKKNPNWTYDDSDPFPHKKLLATVQFQDGTEKDVKSTVDESKISFWGLGYTDEEYREFERKYHRLKKNYKEKTEMHTESLKTYIRYRAKEEFATARGDSKEAKAWGELAAKAATDAKLNPSQMSKSDVSDGVDVMSQLSEIAESYVGVIPIMPRILEQPYDDADMIIWSVVNYSRKLEEKPRVSYREIYQFYDKMIEDYCKDKNMTSQEIEEYKAKRNNTFRDMELVFQEPLYGSSDDEGFEDEL